MKKGCVRIVTVDREEYFFTEGDVFYLPKGLRYRSHWKGAQNGENAVEWESYGFEFLPCPDDKSYRVQKLTLDSEAVEYLNRVSETMLISAKNAGYLYLFLDIALSKMVAVDSDPRALLAERAKKYIEENDPLRVPELAKYCNMSESGLYGFFREYLLTTPIEMKNRLRVNKAIEMLRFTSASVEEISTELGFSSTAYFRRIVKEFTGKTPTRIRREFKHI